MFIVKYSPTELNFGYDFVLLVHFLGHPVDFKFVLFLTQMTKHCDALFLCYVCYQFMVCVSFTFFLPMHKNKYSFGDFNLEKLKC